METFQSNRPHCYVKHSVFEQKVIPFFYYSFDIIFQIHKTSKELQIKQQKFGNLKKKKIHMQNITLKIIIFGVSWHLQLIKLRTANQKRKSNRMEKNFTRA